MTSNAPAHPSADRSRQYLHSTLILNQLARTTERLDETDGINALQHIFGYDISPLACQDLWRCLRQGTLQSPALFLTDIPGFRADYDNRDRIIRIDRTFFSKATEHPDHHWELLSVLIHEFGHHLDNLLRQDFSRPSVGLETLSQDAEGEEGHRFSAWLISTCAPAQDQVTIATLHEEAHPAREYAVSWQQARQAIEEMLDGIDDRIDSQHLLPDREGFEAGSDDSQRHTHQNIEWVLSDHGFSRKEVDAVYFGNWLRDYSQVVDPKITRGVDMTKDFPAIVSRQAWTDIVDVLAAKKFIDLRMESPAEMKVTTERLGVYLPHEHLDNPLTVSPAFPDPKERDPDFEPWVLPGNPLTEIDPETSMKRYVSRSVTYLQQQMQQAMKHGRSLEGLRHYGAALHVLEDLFAHSNFAELSLIQRGHENVIPWTAAAASRHDLALVTGTFGGSDVIASLAAPLGKMLFSTTDLEFELTQPGYRSDRDKLMAILLSEHSNPQYLAVFNALLTVRDELIKLANGWGLDTLKFYRWLISTPAGIVLNAYNGAMRGVFSWLGDSIDDAQTVLGRDPNTDPSVEPSHSQLSKDHAEHPLHDLTAQLAREAVRRTTLAMVDHWNGHPNADPIAVATAFFCHPADTDWHHEIVRTWVDANPDQLERAQSRTELDRVHQKAVEELRKLHTQLEADSQRFLEQMFDRQHGEANEHLSLVEQAFLNAFSATPWGKALLELITPSTPKT